MLLLLGVAVLFPLNPRQTPICVCDWSDHEGNVLLVFAQRPDGEPPFQGGDMAAGRFLRGVLFERTAAAAWQLITFVGTGAALPLPLPCFALAAVSKAPHTLSCSLLTCRCDKL